MHGGDGVPELQSVSASERAGKLYPRPHAGQAHDPYGATALARRYLEQVGIPDQADKYPIQLSGGQQQRVAIARALCMQPEVMLFDEPTAALDPEAIVGVVGIMDELAEQGITTVCVTHEMAFSRRIADRIIFMDQGKIVEITPPETFFTSPKSERAQNFLNQMLRY